MNPIVWILLLVGATATATFSAIFGVAGGMMLFVLLALCLDSRSAVPIHAIVQLVSNLARVISSWRDIDRRIMLRFIVPVPLGAYLGGLCVEYTNPQVLEIGIGITILVMINLPNKKNKAAQAKREGLNVFVLLGFLSSFLGMLVGAVGPLISPFFLRQPLTKHGMVATKAACQAVVHLTKIPTFVWVVHFDYAAYGILMLTLCAVTIVGTWIGKNLIDKISDTSYHHWERIILTVLALIIMTKAVVKLIQGA